jgi:hypothetical protein
MGILSAWPYHRSQANKNLLLCGVGRCPAPHVYCQDTEKGVKGAEYEQPPEQLDIINASAI